MSGTMAVPPHVSPERVLDYDFYADPGLRDDPHERFVNLLKTAPEVFYTPCNGGHWVIIGESAIMEMSRDADRFSNLNVGIPPLPADVQQITYHPLDLDEPEHGYYRAVLSPLFSPKAVNALEGEIRRMAVDLIEKVRNQGGCELNEAVAMPLPVLVFIKQMGMDQDRYIEFCHWAQAFFDSPDAQVKLDAMTNVLRYMGSLIQQRIAEPKDDWISAMLAAKINGQPADPIRDVSSMCNLLFLAGLDTVKNAICHFAIALAQRPDLQKRLRDDPAITPEAVEELLRDRIGTNPMRTLKRDGVFRGVHMRKGEPVLFCLPTVGIDDKAVERPLELDFDRDQKPHLSFGAGPHRCAGSHLARLELRVFLEEWMKRIPEFRIKPGTRPEYRPNNVNTVANLELVW